MAHATIIPGARPQLFARDGSFAFNNVFYPTGNALG